MVPVDCHPGRIDDARTHPEAVIGAAVIWRQIRRCTLQKPHSRRLLGLRKVSPFCRVHLLG
jgi:hypothetical protein